MTDLPALPQPPAPARYPFVLHDAFFICVDFQRAPDIKPSASSGFNIAIKIAPEKYPDHFQVNLRTNPQEDSPIKLAIELVGLFKYTGQDPDTDRSKIVDFLNDQGFLMLWQHIVQLIRTLTPQMGAEGVYVTLHPSIQIEKDSLPSGIN